MVHRDEEVAEYKNRQVDLNTMLDYRKYFILMQMPVPSDAATLRQRLVEDGLIGHTTSDVIEVTKLGALLFAENLEHWQGMSRKAVRIIIRESKGRLGAVARELRTARGYAAGFETLFQQLDSHLPAREEVKNGLRKVDRAYPESAVRELLANMLVHQDFSISGMGPMIEIFSDRVEFTNPGRTLVEPLRLIGHPPRSRNEKLVDLMRRLNICEERGTGISNAVGAIELCQLPPPKFISDSDFFKVILYASRELEDMTRKEKIMACYQHCCLKHVNGESMSNSSLRARLGIKEDSYPIASRIIRDTIEQKLIKPLNTTSASKRLARYIPVWA